MAADSVPDAVCCLTIDRLGGLGDGIASLNGQPVFVPYTLPGEVVRIKPGKVGQKGIRAELLEILAPSPERAAPDCSHFGYCGGCGLQHLRSSLYRRFKMQGMADMLGRLGVEASVLAKMVETGPGSRRRAEFKLEVEKGEVRIGFHAPKSHHLIDLAMCPVVDARIAALLPPLRACVAQLAKPGNIQAFSAFALPQGAAGTVRVRSMPKPADREKLVAFAKEQGLMRFILQVEGQEETQRLYGSEVLLRLGAVEVELPDGAFLQASAVGEAALVQAVCSHLAGCRRVADLYAGCGTYSFPLLQAGSAVHAYEGGEAMTVAMENTSRAHALEPCFTVMRRDLFRRPLTASELRHFDGVVINPPRNGALPQTKEIAASGIHKLSMVSCNPASFERDAQPLLAAGFRLERLLPVDQFFWSNHLELVANFTRCA